MKVEVSQDYTLKRGEVWEDSFKIVEEDGVTPAYDDMGSWTAKLQVRDSVTGELICELSTENDGIAIDGDTGEVAWIAHTAETQDWDFIMAVYDLKLVDTAGDERFVYDGNINLKERVTE